MGDTEFLVSIQPQTYVGPGSDHLGRLIIRLVWDGCCHAWVETALETHPVYNVMGLDILFNYFKYSRLYEAYTDLHVNENLHYVFCKSLSI